MRDCYDVHSPEGEFLMRAPMMVISAAFGFHPDAARRVIRELDEEGANISHVHFNGRPKMLCLERIEIRPVKL